MTLAQVKKQCKEMHKGKHYTENFYLIKYPLIGWTIGTSKDFSTSNTKAIDMRLFTI
ncbi:hypothetical protein GCM10023310_70810 [Paenibacillus vulneris]|uniref:Uncharacterized protein n=1 Tax=Paenibacillus vulneris TaxID=1133364 RepID=A0ABW3UFZ5_9BACL